MDITNLTANTTFDPDEEVYLDHVNMYTIPLVVLCILAAVADCLIIYVILKYDEMRTHVNLYLLNWCISNLLVLPIVPVSMNVSVIGFISEEVLCLMFESLLVVMSGNLLFVAVTLVDWYLMTYGTQNCFIKFKKSAVFVCFTVWIVILAFGFLSVSLCLHDISFPLSAIMFLLTYFFVFVTIILIHVLRLVKKNFSNVVMEKDIFILKLVSWYFLAWLLNWFLLFGQIIIRRTHMSLEYFSFYLGFSYPLIMLYLLYHDDKTFKKCFRHMCGHKDEPDDQNNRDNFVTVLL
ncbi:kappa-type opioid receptor-like [Aethina tumida]|uniref:kappa-type opioid receptor-like n=1 Tax=Aethina tumida TaxID=116153 RepID=UPI002149320B|nr:kappa-type opioid receptor-like [Aethina tumida]